MDEIISQLQKEYKLNGNDMFVMQYIIEHSEEVTKLSSHQLSKLTFTSPTAIIRFVKKLGFENYSDFKIHIHTFLNKYYLANMQIISHESMDSIKNKLSEIESGIINQTKDLIKTDIFNEMMLLISQNKYIDIIANDTNASIGEYASHLLLSVDKIVNVYHNQDKQLWLSLNADSQHTIIIISKYGKNKHFLKIANILKKKHIPFVVMTTHHSYDLALKTPLTLYGVIHEEFESLKDMIFYISLKYIFDLIYTLLISENLKQAKELDDLYGQLFDKFES